MRITSGLSDAISLKLDGDNDYLISTPKNELANLKIPEEALDGMNLRIVYKHGSYYIVGDN